MKFKLLALMGLWVYDAHAILWPSISDPAITGCSDQNYGCANSVFYKHSGTVMLEQPVLINPPNTSSLTIRAYGIHCQTGSKMPGFEAPFGGCGWDISTRNTHAPVTGNCTLSSAGSWELKASSTCATDLTWGGHGGAGPGGECVMFGIMVGSVLYTPMGTMDALTAANSGNRFCVKPLPPATKCELQLNDTILDHGVLPPAGSSTANVTGSIECGQKPVVEFVGGADFTIAPGVNAALNANVDTTLNKITINSRVTTVNASGGNYSASKVITVSPW
ncbi:hypothetical protein UXO62_01415 [Enterobacter cloacae]|uniref:hypothetical protein n=1 Tax=Enterobacter cloacae TaxID=550 RepID=UPI002FD48FD7